MSDSLRDSMLLMSELAVKYKDCCLTEEATKTSLVLPFIKNLGYDIFSPLVLVPEYCADFGVKSGEKVDYALFSDNTLIMLFEVKSSSTVLSSKHVSQLFRYYSVSNVNLAILTNGIEYQIYTDLAKDNIMDTEPSYIFNICNLKEFDFKVLSFLSNGNFNVKAIRDLILCSNFAIKLDDYLSSLNDDLVEWFKSSLDCEKVPTDIAREIISARLSIPINEKPQDTELLGTNNGNESKALEIMKVNKGYVSDSLENFKPKRITGFKCVSISIENVVYKLNKWCDILSSFLDYISKYKGISIDYILNDAIMNKYFVSEEKLFKRVGVFHYPTDGDVFDLYYERNVSAQESLNIIYRLCTATGISASTISITALKRRS